MIKFLPCSVDVIKCLPSAYHNHSTPIKGVLQYYLIRKRFQDDEECRLFYCNSNLGGQITLVKILICANMTCSVTRWTQNYSVNFIDLWLAVNGSYLA